MNNKKYNTRRGLVLLSVALFAVLAMSQPVSAAEVAVDAEPCDVGTEFDPSVGYPAFRFQPDPSEPWTTWVAVNPGVDLGLKPYYDLSCIGQVDRLIQ